MTSEEKHERFAQAIDQWAKLPIDDFGYVSKKETDSWTNTEFKERIDKFIQVRNDENGWRNSGGLWRKLLTDNTTNKKIIDYGCGFGVETLEFLKQEGNKVWLSDIHTDNMMAAERVLGLYGYESEGHVLSQFDAPFFEFNEKVDIFYSNGVLHHSPNIRGILKRACEILNPCGEIRLMLYSDQAWLKKTTLPLVIVFLLSL